MHNSEEIQSKQFDDEENAIDFKKIINKIKGNWLWFMVSVFVCLLVAFLYVKYTAPTYRISARLLVNDDEKGGGLGKQSGALMDLGGLLGSKNSVDNEAEILKTRSLMEQVVAEMNLNVVYFLKANLVSRELPRSPFKLNILQSVDTIQMSGLEVRKLANNKLKITSGEFDKEVAWNEAFYFKGIGTIQFVPKEGIPMNNGEYFVTVSSIDARVAALMGQLDVTVSNKQVTIIDLGFSYPLQRKGEDILNTLIKKYTEANLSDKNAIADSTAKFIKERLSVIARELGDEENKVETFKQENNLADMSEQGKLLVQSTSEFTNQLAKAETEVAILEALEKFLKDEKTNTKIAPSSLMPQDIVFSDLMTKYNSLQIQREERLLDLNEKNPFIINLDTQIAGLRKSILSNIQSTKAGSLTTRNKLMAQLNKATAQIGGVPEIEKNYLKLARNKDIKQELYIFLMQKAEETAISKTANISIAKAIDPPKAAVMPISPKNRVIYLTGFAIGLVLPLMFIFGLDLLNTSVATKEDVLTMTRVPVIGEIDHNASDDNLIVANQSRSAISEQFRALRTNLAFYLKSKDEKVILLTSSMSGEGKSFTAINLGNILALTGKRVLLMELDLRKPGLSAKLAIQNEIGFSNFTINPDIKVKDIVKPLSINKNMFIIGSGPLPPNPAETLMSDHMPTLMEELKSQFDYIIMDAPPIGIVTDAQLLSTYADVTIYLVRQKFTQKEQLSIAEDLYRKGKMKNLTIVVNDIQSKYYTYGYGYGYGYGTYGEEQKRSISSKLKRFFKV